jgi:hypothetical protein
MSREGAQMLATRSGVVATSQKVQAGRRRAQMGDIGLHVRSIRRQSGIKREVNVSQGCQDIM